MRKILYLVVFASIFYIGYTKESNIVNKKTKEEVEVGDDKPMFSFGMVVNETRIADVDVDEDEEEKFEKEKLKLKNVAIFIRSQRYPFHQERADALRKNLLEQASAIKNSGKLDVVCSHDREFPNRAWTISSVIPMLRKGFMKKKWIFFCEETTEINLKRLLDVLGNYDSREEHFLGHALKDTQPVIIHHFYHDDLDFEYPDLDAGWALSLPAVTGFVEKVNQVEKKTQFTIDVKHEIAMTLFDKGRGIELKNVPQFCINQRLEESDCASTVNYAEPGCGEVPVDKIFVGVKTFSGFHETRLPVVINTIGKQTTHIRYYSDKDNASIPTYHSGVANTERGHCQKTYLIIKRFHETIKMSKKDWLLIMDDDTIISLHRLRKILACYDPEHKILLGERYGFGSSRENTYGYDYITGGGGMVLSRAGARELMRSGQKCSSNESPDDMWLGHVFRSLKAPSIHSTSFHQARPVSYSKELLSHQYLVSFHKHRDIDPMKVFETYLNDK